MTGVDFLCRRDLGEIQPQGAMFWLTLKTLCGS